MAGGGWVACHQDGDDLRVKICGITNSADALVAAVAGADAIGLNFVGGPRQISVGVAAAILESLPPLVTPVALVRLQDGRLSDGVAELLGRYRVSHLQVYGPVAAGAIDALACDGFCVMPVIAVRGVDFAREAVLWRDCRAGRPRAVVLDSYDPLKEGGTGTVFHWEIIPAAVASGAIRGWPPIILAGGLRPGNVAEAVQVARPFGVDVSSGVEVEGSPGRKDAAKVREFVLNARAAAGRLSS
ncbi:MAG: phosphoribosylanthranilate isomerase [Phycisphaerae bacterium]|nr:phosphoribosylanthranilate isomerase [Phycisphaerae bacterium]